MNFLASLRAQPRFVAVVTLGIILIVGGVLRLHNVDYRTLDHGEAYTPGIDLPWYLSNPNPRFSLWQTLAGTIAGEPHPPGYYVMMLGWTKWFGSSIFSLRLPSLLFGVASILLIYLLAYHTEDTLSALLAASMIALNGLHLYWSQNSRMYSMACFLGLLSTVLLVSIVKHGVRSRTYGILYVLSTVAGLATHVYFWPLFVSQVLWVFATTLHARSLIGLLRLRDIDFHYRDSSFGDCAISNSSSDASANSHSSANGAAVFTIGIPLRNRSACRFDAFRQRGGSDFGFARYHVSCCEPCSETKRRSGDESSRTRQRPRVRISASGSHGRCRICDDFEYRWVCVRREVFAPGTKHPVSDRNEFSADRVGVYRLSDMRVLGAL